MSLPLFYHVGATLNALANMNTQGEERVDFLLKSYNARARVAAVLDALPLTVCQVAAAELLNAIDEWGKLWASREGKPIDASERIEIQTMAIKARALETILTAELQTLDTYHPSQKGIYSTRDLVAQADHMLPDAIRDKLTPEVVEEIRQSGRCLAFDNATASGFHIMRATEALMHQYYLTVCKPKPPPKARLDNWGEYLTAFKACTSQHAHEVAALLQQVKDQHRNPIMHPEVVLSVEEAFTLFQVAQAAIIAMASKLRPPKAAQAKKPKKTSPS